MRNIIGRIPSLQRGALAIALVALSGQALAAGQKVALFGVDPAAVGAPRAAAIDALMAQGYAAESKDEVIAAAQTAAARGEGESNVQVAQKLGAAEYLELSAVALETKLVVTGVRRSANGEELFRAQLTAASFDDLDAVCQRLSRSLAQRVAPEESRNVKNVTQSESRVATRAATERNNVVRIGVDYPIGWGQGYEPQISIAGGQRYDRGNAFFELGAGLEFATSASSDPGYGGVYLDIGGAYYAEPEAASTLYYGGGLQPRLTLGSFIDSPIGLLPYGQIGWVTGRDSNMKFFVEGRLAQNVVPIHNNGGEGKFPTEVGIFLGLLR